MMLSEDTSSFIGGDDQWPPGFRFHPTDEELVLYYLKRKICRLRLKLDAIAEVDVYKADPEDLPRLSKLKTGDRQWFFFSPRDRKYSNKGRSNRATKHGYWKATGKDRAILCNSRSVGIKKTLVFYRGRAPSGERTDWVMHEYTLDEEELKRCPAQDYYALYKIYKKSGPGPKNGEQYGAPFREEDWADDGKEIENVDKEQLTLFNTGTNCSVQSQLNGLDEFLNRVVNDPLFEPVSEPCGTVPVAFGKDNIQNIYINQSLGERNAQERVVGISPSVQFNSVQPHFNLAQSASSQFQDSSEVTYATNVNRQRFQDPKDLIDDFLEIDDLIGPEPTIQNIENPVDDFQIEDFDGLCELDLFDDVSMYLNDVIDIPPASNICNNNTENLIYNPIPFSCPNNLENGVLDQVPNSYLNNFQTDIVQPISLPFYNNFGNELVDRFNFQLPHDPDVRNSNFSITTPAVSNQGSVIPPTSGVVYAGVNQNQFENLNQNQNGKVNEGEESWLSSSLWSFLENIPTTPASATESTVLVNKAFERFSSFSRRGDSIKVSLLNRNASEGDLNSTRRRSRNKCSKGFLLFSLLGVLYAIMCVFAGTSVSVTGS